MDNLNNLSKIQTIESDTFDGLIQIIKMIRMPTRILFTQYADGIFYAAILTEAILKKENKNGNSIKVQGT